MGFNSGFKVLTDKLSPCKQRSVTTESMPVQNGSKGSSLALCLPPQFQNLLCSSNAVDNKRRPAVRHIQLSARNGVRKLVHTSCVQSGLLTYMVIREQVTQIGIRENYVQDMVTVWQSVYMRMYTCRSYM